MECTDAQPRGGSPPEVWREGGAGRPGSRPLASDRNAWGTKNALLGRLRRPPGAWIGPSTMPCGVSEARLHRNPHPLVLERASRESPAPFPIKSGDRRPWAPALGRSDPPCRARYRTTAPRLLSEARCRPPRSASPRHLHDATSKRSLSSSAHIYYEPGLTIPRRWLYGAASEKKLAAPIPACSASARSNGRALFTMHDLGRDAGLTSVAGCEPEEIAPLRLSPSVARLGH